MTGYSTEAAIPARRPTSTVSTRTKGPRAIPTTDCNDANTAINPAAIELVGDEVDQNCDGRELCLVDQDGDGY